MQPFKDARGRIYYSARITYPDGERLWLKPRFDERERAEEYADDKSREAEKRGEGEGIAAVRKDRYDWHKWISPRIGPRPIADITRDEIEDVRSALDVEVKKRLADGLDHGMCGKTAANIWSVGRATALYSALASAASAVLASTPASETATHVSLGLLTVNGPEVGPM